MDYEKKYNEALERVRRLHDRMLVLSSTDALVASSELEFIFPELAEIEDEDERIRKELIEAFEAYDIESKWNGIPIRSIFAWLEKQKEPKHATDSKSERVIKAARSVLNNWLDGTDCPDVSGDFAELEYAIREYDDEEKQKEQKPAWSEEDEEMINTLVDYVEDPSCWNLKCPREKLVAFIKSLPERFNLQSKQEWSEEDEEMLEYVIGDLNDAKQLFHAKDAIDLCDKEIAWLKSLRPQPKRDCKDCAMFLNGECTKPHWKPSEEQMAALEAATVRYQSTGLESLYEDLKKL